MRRLEYELTLLDDAGAQLPTSLSGHVRITPGNHYTIAVRNAAIHPVRVVVRVDGRVVSGQTGLMLDAGELLELPHPVGDRGLFTAFVEGSDAVFGADGGRGNPELGLIEATYQPLERRAAARALFSIVPRSGSAALAHPSISLSGVGAPAARGHDALRSIEPASMKLSDDKPCYAVGERTPALLANAASESSSPAPIAAAGTGLTDWSSIPSPGPAPKAIVALGSPVVIALRLVTGEIGSDLAQPDTLAPSAQPIRPEARS